MMKQLSKSKYAKYCQCPKCLWMSVYKPEEEVVDPSSEARFENGTEVGDLAMGLLGEYVDVTTNQEDGRLDLSAMITKTKQLMEAGQSRLASPFMVIQARWGTRTVTPRQACQSPCSL